MKWHVVLFALLMLGCAAEQPPAPETSALPQRIISLAPSITEILFAVGAGEKVVGVTTYCNHPESAGKLAKVGDFVRPDFEKIVALKPDLVIATTDSSAREAVEKIRSLGLATLVVEGRSFRDLLGSIAAIGRAVGNEEEAKKLSSRIERDWETVGRPATLLLYGVNPLVAAGSGSLGDELIRQAGGRNIFAGSDNAYVTTDHEKIISLAPEVIVQVAMGTESNEKARQYWSRWTAIPAVKNNRVYVLDPDLVTRPGPRIIEALKLLREAIRGQETDR